jgi:hypothetical protein
MGIYLLARIDEQIDWLDGCGRRVGREEDFSMRMMGSEGGEEGIEVGIGVMGKWRLSKELGAKIVKNWLVLKGRRGFLRFGKGGRKCMNEYEGRKQKMGANGKGNGDVKMTQRRGMTWKRRKKWQVKKTNLGPTAQIANAGWPLLNVICRAFSLRWKRMKRRRI